MRATLALLTAGAAAAAPSQVHTAFAAATSFRAAWKTSGAEPSTCMFGTSPTAMTSVANGSAVSYLPGHGFHHAVLIAAPEGSADIFWSCGSAAGGMTAAARFVFPAPTATFSTMVFADW